MRFRIKEERNTIEKLNLKEEGDTLSPEELVERKLAMGRVLDLYALEEYMGREQARSLERKDWRRRKETLKLTCSNIWLASQSSVRIVVDME